jgi:ABC-type nitrate/sulfonate/bicarbonate transport system ATPase subunit
MLLDIALDAKDHIGADGRPRRVLEDLRLALARGEAGAVLGPSGCGKTTLLRIIAGLDSSYAGRVTLPQHSRLGMVFQEPLLLPWRSVRDNLRIAAPQASMKEIEALLDAFGLAGHAGQFPGRLSLGLARRAALARALAVKPDLLLLDEPLVSLDGPLAASLRDRIARLIDETHVTTLIVTHDVAEAVALADKIFVLSKSPARVVATLDVPTPRRFMTSETAQALAQKAQEALAGA